MEIQAKMHTCSYSIVVFVLLCVIGQFGCGGIGGDASMSPSNHVPSIEALSPNSSKQGGPAFTLSVVGSNLLSSSFVQWNGSSLPTAFVNSKLVAADIPASSLTARGLHAVTIVTPAPGGGTSNSLNFTVPCVIPAPTPASEQTRARLGAYFFDGWAGSLTNFHFQGLPLGPYQDRQPLSGWQDSSTCAVEQQLAWAHNFGLDFFVFDWYYNPLGYEDDNLNNALQTTQSLPDRHGMQFAIMYVDDPFTVRPADWTAVVNEWVGYMTDPGYALVNGKPLLVVYDMEAMRQIFGSSASVASAFNQLRAAAEAHGLAGVYIVGCLFGSYDSSTQSGSFSDLSMVVAEGYDAVTMYNYHFGTMSGAQPFSILSEAGRWIWDQAVLNSPLPFIPVAMDGWDARPWSEGNVWFSRSPQDVAGFVNEAITWADSNPQLRPEPSPTPPIVLIEAWNEVGEGSYLIPTVGDGPSYGDALAAMLLTTR